LQLQQLAQQHGTSRLRRVAQVIFDPWPRARLPGVLEAVTDTLDAVHQGKRFRITAGTGLIAHGAISSGKSVRWWWHHNSPWRPSQPGATSQPSPTTSVASLAAIRFSILADAPKEVRRVELALATGGGPSYIWSTGSRRHRMSGASPQSSGGNQ